MEKLLQGLGLFALAMLSIVLKAWVLVVLWGWFIVTAFHAPPINKPIAYGISSIALLLVYAGDQRSAEEQKKSLASQIGTVITKALLSPLVVLLGAWIAHKLM